MAAAGSRSNAARITLVHRGNGLAGMYGKAALDGGRGPHESPDSGDDCNDWGDVLGYVGDAAGWTYIHTEVSYAAACLGYCIGVGFQGGHGFIMHGEGCCYFGPSIGLTRQEYEDCPCIYLTGGGPVKGVSVYADGGVSQDGSLDYAGGVAGGGGAGMATITNTDVGPETWIC
jgi:hypothetical protein